MQRKKVVSKPTLPTRTTLIDVASVGNVAGKTKVFSRIRIQHTSASKNFANPNYKNVLPNIINI
jgi:hypothetical protein